MQIACPQCSNKYDLDARLLPPSGASVQCTRCSFVFTALPSGEVLVPGQAQGTQGNPALSTRVFGSPYTASPKPGDRGATPATHTTQIFGAIPPPEPGAAAAGTAPVSPPDASASERTPGYGTGVVPAGGADPSRTPGGGVAAVGSPPAPAIGKTAVFGAAPPRAPSPTTTQVFGAVAAPAPAPSAASTQVFGAAAAPASAPSAASTQVFGAAAAPGQQPSATSTQVFGAAAAPGQQPSAATTQTFGSAAVASRLPPAALTQVFGADTGPRKAPSPTTTQSFGAASIPTKAPSASTTQVFGAASVLSPSPTPVTTQSFGASEVQAARKAATGTGEGGAPASWLAEPGPSPSPPRSGTGEHPSGASPAPSIALPEEPVPLPGSALPSLPPEPLMEREAAPPPSRRAPALELPPEMFVPGASERGRPAQEQASGGGTERILIILAAVVALGLTAWLSYPVWRNQGSDLPPDAVSAKDSAVSLLRRDDAASREQAIAQLRALVERHPKFTEAQAELVVALSLQLDDVKVELEWLGQQEEQLQKEIAALGVAKATADWQSRVNARREELAALSVQKRPLDASVADLTKQLEKGLGFIRAAPETEPSADVVARVKAQAVYEGVQGNQQAVALAERLRKVESPPHWSALTLAEYGLNARSPPAALTDLAEGLAQVRERDKTFLRAYVLGARLALRLQDRATAQTLLDTVVALNPHHALARKLQKWASSPARTP